MPVLAAKIRMKGKLAGDFPDAKHPFARIQPFILKEVAGIKLAIIGVTAPGMPFWLWPEFIRGLDFPHPVEPVRRAIHSAKREGSECDRINRSHGTKGAHRRR